MSDQSDVLSNLRVLRTVMDDTRAERLRQSRVQRKRAVMTARVAYKQGHTMGEICDAIGVDRITLAQWAREHGTTISGRTRA